MAGFSLSAVVGNRIDKKDDHDNGSDSDEDYTVTKTQDTEAPNYDRESPVHTMTDKQLRRERVGGYLIGFLATLFIAFLVAGYIMTMDVPLCVCENDDYEQTGECEFTKLSENQQKQCSDIFQEEKEYLVEVTKEKPFKGDCAFKFEQYKYGVTNLHFSCNTTET